MVHRCARALQPPIAVLGLACDHAEPIAAVRLIAIVQRAGA
ncbi:hypothetical protein ACR720_14365 [Sphingomonas parapaucimobilis]|nr:hypothetical protein [Sphingomonas sp. Sph1(2015)]